MSNLSLEEIRQQYEGHGRESVFFWYAPKATRIWERPRWVDVTTDLANLSNERLDQLVRATPNLHYSDEVPLEDRSFDRFLKRRMRRQKLRDKLVAFYGPNRRVGPSPLFDATVFALVIVLGAANLFV